MSGPDIHVPGGVARRILVVEDERVVRLDLAAKLVRLGYRVVGQAVTGVEAVQMAGDLMPDLVLMDVVLGLGGADCAGSRDGSHDGPCDGIAAAARIGESFDIPVVYLTAHADDETLARATLTGPFGYLIKPPSEVDLRTSVELALYKHGVEAELKRARDEACEANALKASFLATVSHELRTPMNGILGMVELLRQSGLDGESMENVDLLKRSAQQLMGVLNHILEYSKLEAKRFDLTQEDFRLKELLDGVLARYRDVAGEGGCSLAVEIDPALPDKFHGDGRTLGRILDQLVDNAIRHGGPGLVRIVVRPGNPEEHGGPQPLDPFKVLLHFKIIDSGVGIPSGKLERVFDSFMQVENYLTRHQGGLGLGLALCRKMVRAMGGTIWAEPGPEGGSRFHVQVPLVPREGADALSGTEAERSRMAGVRVLVADDDMVSRLFVVRSLEKNGVTALGAADGDQTLEILGRAEVDAVLMDVEMPGPDGIEITERVRAGKVACPSDLPIIALTAHALLGDEQRCLDVGMNDYLAKPVDTGTMLATLGRHVRPRSGESL